MVQARFRLDDPAKTIDSLRIRPSDFLDADDTREVLGHYRQLRSNGWTRQGARRKAADLIIALGAFDNEET